MMHLLKSPRVLCGLLVALVIGWLYSAFDATITIHAKDVFSFDSFQASLLFLCVGLPEALAPFIGRMSDKWGPRWIVAGGFIFMTPFLILLRLSDHESTQQIVQFAAMLTCTGLGLAFIGTPLMGELTNAVIVEENKTPGSFGYGRGFGQVYGLFNVAFAIGSLVGPFQAGPTLTAHGWGLTTLSLAIISFVMAFPTAYWFDGSLRTKIKIARGRRGD
jgi:MFS family permease